MKEESFKKIIEHYDSISERLLNPSLLSHVEFAKLAKEQSDMEYVINLIRKYNSIKLEAAELEKAIGDDYYNNDPEFVALMLHEKELSNEKSIAILAKLKIALLPKDKDDERGVILEIRAGTGGEEAALFAAELYRMYAKYAEKQRWIFEILSISETGLDGYKEASANIRGKGVYARLKFESGVHRVQRIPETDAGGRIHTSAATVAVLPEVEDIDIVLADKDLKIDVYRASGAGGQHVNTTDSAVRITHLPTGVVVTQQDEKSQHKNKAKALKILRARIYEAERYKREAERSELRKGQVKSGDRSERIRTYNYPQNRVTDHRVNIVLYALNEVIAEGKLDKIIESLIADAEARKLASAENNNP